MPFTDIGPLKIEDDIHDEDACIDAFSLESHSDVGPLHIYDRAKQAVSAETDRPYALRMRAGQCHVHRYMAPLMQRIRAGEIDLSFVITHRMPLEEAPTAYKMFRDKKDDCAKVVLLP